MSNQSTPFVSSTGESRNPFYEGQFDGETPEQAIARLHWARAATETAAIKAGHGEAVLPSFAKKVIGKLCRFEECTDDGQGADIGRHWFDILTQLGLLNRVQRSPALWEITQQGDDLLAITAAPEAILVEAVAVTKENEDGELYLDWILEGGIAALEFSGTTLLVAHGEITDGTGSGEVYTAPPATADAVSVPVEQRELEWLEHWLLFASEPVGQECCNRPGSECCGCPDTCYRTADDIVAAMHARHEELRAPLAQVKP